MVWHNFALHFLSIAAVELGEEGPGVQGLVIPSLCVGVWGQLERDVDRVLFLGP